MNLSKESVTSVKYEYIPTPGLLLYVKGKEYVFKGKLNAKEI